MKAVQMIFLDLAHPLRLGKLFSVFILLASLILLSGCKGKEKSIESASQDDNASTTQTTPEPLSGQQSSPSPVNPVAQYPPREVSGELFLVLKSRETLKLSLVKVFVINDQIANTLFLSSTNFATGGKWDFQIRSFSTDWARARKDYEIMRGLYEKTDVKASELWELRKNLYSRRGAIYSMRYGYEKAKANEENEKLIKDATEQYNDYSSQASNYKKETEEYKAKLTQIEVSRNGAFGLLQNASETSVLTDSEGRFSLTLDAGKKIFLFAHVQRELPGIIEEFGWLVQVGDEQKQKMLLSNHNAFLTASAFDYAK
jgi:hypothetical protein